MKIGLMSTTIYPLRYPWEGYAGIEKLVTEKAVELFKMGHEVTVFAPIGSKLIDGIKVIETVKGGINYNYADEENAMKIIMTHLYNNHIDILEDNTHQKYSYIYYDELKKLNIKLCSVLHCQCNFTNPPPGVPKMNLICISNSHMAETSGILGIHAEIVYNGIDLSLYKYNDKKEDYFITLSRIARMKGIHEAIQAAKELGEKLYVAGEDIFVNDNRYVFDIMSSCDGKKIVYLGNISEQKKIELLSKAKALVLPILWNEPFGIVILEALASGTPVITTPRGAMTEIVQHKKSGLFCYNVGEIKSAMKIINEIKPEDCLKRAEMFTTKIMSERYLQLYERILSGNEW